MEHDNSHYMTTGGDLQTKISSVFTQVPYMFKNASDFMSLANMKNEDLSGRREREREREEGLAMVGPKF